jgi:hypothetical protein
MGESLVSVDDRWPGAVVLVVLVLPVRSVVITITGLFSPQSLIDVGFVLSPRDTPLDN